MKRSLRYLWRSVVALLLAAIGVYVLLVHPNDARLAFPPGPADGPPPQPFERRASLLTSRLEHAEDLGDAAYLERRQALLAALPDYALPTSVRFVSPYQVYVPAGIYPLRLDARDAVYVPTGATLRIKPRLAGRFDVRFSAYSPQSPATLTVGIGKHGSHRIDLSGPPRVWIDYSGKLYHDYLRFLRADPAGVLETWVDERFADVLAEDDEVALTCGRDARFGCIIGDVAFDAPAGKRPENVLFVLVDTLRADALRAGNAPRMAALADGGVEFTRALAPGNMTSPSTNALLSCRRPSQLGGLAFSYGVSPEVRDHYYRTRHVSFPGRFLQAGYDTAMIGNVSVVSEIYGVGINHGFSRQVSLETDGYDTPAIAREAIQWLETNGDHPFFLYLHFNGPHAPYRPPLTDLWSTFPGLMAFHSYARTLLWLYQGEVAFTDRYLARVLAALKSLGLEDHTTIVLTADHGDQHRSHRFAGNTAAPEFTGAYFDHGATLLDDEIHVPLVIKRPGARPRRIDDYVSTLDLGPTLLEMLGVGDARGCAGASLAPYLNGQATTALRDRVIGSEGFQGRMVLFDGRYKYVRTYEPTDKKIYPPDGWIGQQTLWLVPEQLFDLAVDPDEQRDLAAEEPALLARGRAIYRQLYEVHDAYDLVIETPKAEPFTARFPPGTAITFEEGNGSIESDAGEVTVRGEGRERWLLDVRYPPGRVERPTVRIGGQPVAVRATSLRLPLTVTPEALPEETGGRYTVLASGREATAYLRRIEDDGQANRRLVTGNPAFEKVLREWGYLNDK